VFVEFSRSRGVGGFVGIERVRDLGLRRLRGISELGGSGRGLRRGELWEGAVRGWRVSGELGRRRKGSGLGDRRGNEGGTRNSIGTDV